MKSLSTLIAVLVLTGCGASINLKRPGYEPSEEEKARPGYWIDRETSWVLVKVDGGYYIDTIFEVRKMSEREMLRVTPNARPTIIQKQRLTNRELITLVWANHVTISGEFNQDHWEREDYALWLARHVNNGKSHDLIYAWLMEGQ